MEKSRKEVAVNQANYSVLERVRASLGRSGETPPAPPEIPDRVARLVPRDANLVEVFTKNATAMHMLVQRVTQDELTTRLVEFLLGRQIKKLAMPGGELLEQLGVYDALRADGFDVRLWRDITLDELYDGYECGLTDVNYAVAETGMLVIKPTAAHGRALTLVPMHHVAVVRQKNILADQIDLMETIATDPQRHNWILIAGPSKTADIEMNVVTGVHGPNVVQTFIVA
jgi:L-lactate dehydrogenase complex protein LldG